jgi:hypothetical protein
MPRTKEKESEILRAICDYLSLRGHFFWRQNNVPVFNEGRFRALPKHSMKGIPDIIVIKTRRFIGVEVKSPTGKLSPEQETFRDKCIENGGEYIVARGIDDVQAIGL